jgi:cobalt/nickel transport system ATP-binding protein
MLRLESVDYAYPDGQRALDGVSFAVAGGEAVALVGANGAGKSTLLKLLPGVLLPTGGAIFVDGERLDKASVPRLRCRVGLVMQEADDQLFSPPVYDDVAFGPRNLGFSPKEVAARTEEALAFVGAAHLVKRAPYRLSGGEKRLAALASVLSMDPALLAMDEPSSSLDPRSRRGVIALLLQLPQTRLVATHDLDLVWDACPRVIVLHEGRVAADGPSKKLLADRSLMESCGLELPLRFSD